MSVRSLVVRLVALLLATTGLGLGLRMAPAQASSTQPGATATGRIPGTGSLTGSLTGGHHRAPGARKARKARKAKHKRGPGLIPSSWTATTNRIYRRKVNGRNAYQFLQYRAAHREPGERLAVVLGVDHVAYYDGPRVAATYRFVQVAQRNGYEVYFTSGSGPRKVAAKLAAAGYDDYQELRWCGTENGNDAQARCKAAYRAEIVRSGSTLVANVASNRYGWRYQPSAARTIKLKY